jgi:hypothetical protein
MGKMWAASRLCELYPGLCLTTEENLRRGSRRMPVGTMKTEYTEQIYTSSFHISQAIGV